MNKTYSLIRFDIETTPDGNKVVHYLNTRSIFPRLERVLVNRRSEIKPLFSKNREVTFPYIYYFYPEVKAVKRVLRKLYINENRKLVLTYFNDIAVSQTIYSNPVIQAFFQFALMFVWLDSRNNNIREAIAELERAKMDFAKANTDLPSKSANLEKARAVLTKLIEKVLKKARAGFNNASRDSLNGYIPDNEKEKQSRSRNAANEIYAFAFQASFVCKNEHLKMVGQGTKIGDLRGFTKKVHDLERESTYRLSDLEIAVILKFNLNPKHKEEIQEKIGECMRDLAIRSDIEKKAENIKQIRKRRRRKTKEEFTKLKSKKSSLEK